MDNERKGNYGLRALWVFNRAIIELKHFAKPLCRRDMCRHGDSALQHLFPLSLKNELTLHVAK
jgi:hypothetical protein